MGLSAALSRLAVRQPHVLPVQVPGAWEVRAALENGLSQRGWRVAAAAADADVLAVCGDPGPELLEVINLVWNQIPGPRVRVDITDTEDVDAVLTRAVALLLDDGHQREDARSRPREPERPADGDEEMAPAGIPLAEGTDDRDGLEMDQLHASLGPVLPYWPAGLVLRCSLNGDVITDGHASITDAGARPPRAAGSHTAARQCDHTMNLLALSGWPATASVARRCRDALLNDDGAGMAQVENLERRVRRSVLLRWSLRDLCPLSAAELRARKLPAWWAGDTYDRLLYGVRLARMQASEGDGDNACAPATPELLDQLPAVVTGLDLGAARLVIAGLNIDTAVTVTVDSP